MRKNKKKNEERSFFLFILFSSQINAMVWGLSSVALGSRHSFTVKLNPKTWRSLKKLASEWEWGGKISYTTFD